MSALPPTRLSFGTLSSRTQEPHRALCWRCVLQNWRFATCSPDRISGDTSPEKPLDLHYVALRSCEEVAATRQERCKPLKRLGLAMKMLQTYRLAYRLLLPI